MSEQLDSSASNDNTFEQKKKLMFTYDAPWTTYTASWRRKKDGRFQLAVGSYIEEYTNQIHIISLDQQESEKKSFSKVTQFDHPYPPTKILWAPSQTPMSSTNQDLLASTGDYLRIWNYKNDNTVSMAGVLSNNKHSEYCAPITGFDWNELDTSIIGTCSIDTTCTIWDLNTMSPKTQLIAHDKEVYDISFSCAKDIFGTVSNDGSLRIFDLRSLEHSTIVYETSDLSPLLRLAWNKVDPNYIATIMVESNRTIILDVRMPGPPVAELIGHSNVVNSIAWAPHSSKHICTCGDDRQALIWDISDKTQYELENPILAFCADGEINQLQWDSSHEDWVAICFNEQLQVLKV